MSHFSVLVVGDVDYNMAPFHEFECTGRDDEFVQTIDITESMRAQFLQALEDQKDPERSKYTFDGNSFKKFLAEYHGIDFAPSRKAIDLKKVHKYGYFYPVYTKESKEDPGVGRCNCYRVFRRTNPNKFYDYYRPGYHGFLLKEKSSDGKEQWVSEARKGDIDFQGMFAAREKQAREEHQKVVAALGGIPKLEHTWSSLVDQFTTRDGHTPTMTRDEADAIYKEQQAVKDWDAATKDGRINWMDFGVWVSVDDFAMTEDEYVASRHIHALTFGYVQNRVYHSNGDMGWWAIVSDEKDPNAWDQEYRDFLDTLNDEDYLSILDCHI